MAKILLVEDDNNLREIYEARLQAEGYNIMSAHDGEEALVIAKKDRPDIIISDVMMPRVSGFEMLDILRNTEGLRDAKVIMLTALGQAEDRSRAGSLGADRYLVKSQVTLEDIVKAVQELLTDKPTTPAAAEDVPVPGPVAATPTPATTPQTDDASTPITPSEPASPAEPVATTKPTAEPSTPPASSVPAATPPADTKPPQETNQEETTTVATPRIHEKVIQPLEHDEPKPTSPPAEVIKPEEKATDKPAEKKPTEPAKAEDKPAETSKLEDKTEDKPVEPAKPTEKPAQPPKPETKPEEKPATKPAEAEKKAEEKPVEEPKLPLTAPRPDLPESEVMSDEERKKKLKAGLVLPGVDNSTAPAKPTVIGFGTDDDPAAQLASFVSINSRTAPENEEKKEEAEPATEEKPAESPKAEEKPVEEPKAEEKPVEEAKPTETPKAEEKTEDKPTQSTMSGAIDDLIDNANKQADEKNEPATEEKEEQEAESAPSTEEPKTEEKSAEEAKPDTEKSEAEESEDKASGEADDEDDDNVEVAHKKVIEPLSNTFATDDATDLNALLAKEGHSMQDTPGTEADDPTAMPHFASAHPPGLVFTPDTNDTAKDEPKEEK